MARCQKHLELDQAFDIAESFGQVHGAWAPSTKRKLKYAQSLLFQLERSDHCAENNVNGFTCVNE